MTREITHTTGPFSRLMDGTLCLLPFFSTLLIGCLSSGPLQAQYCPLMGTHFDETKEKCVDGFIDCGACKENRDCGSKVCDLMLGLCAPSGMTTAHACIVANLDGGTTDGGTDGGTGKKIGDKCDVYPNDPLCPPNNSMCVYDNATQYTGTSEGLHCRTPRGIQIFHYLKNPDMTTCTASVYLLTTTGANTYQSVAPRGDLPFQQISTLPSTATYLLFRKCGNKSMGLVFAAGYQGNTPIKTPIQNTTDVTTVAGGITVDGANITDGFLINLSML
jgi:hypothetical protein